MAVMLVWVLSTSSTISQCTDPATPLPPLEPPSPSLSEQREPGDGRLLEQLDRNVKLLRSIGLAVANANNRNGGIPAGATAELNRAHASLKEVQKLLDQQSREYATSERGKVHAGTGLWLNIASGATVSPPGFVAVDLTPREPTGVGANAVHSLPFNDNAADAIYCAHFLEHLFRDEALGVLADLRSILAPGGTLRVVVPDMRLLFRAYAANDTALFASRAKQMLERGLVLGGPISGSLQARDHLRTALIYAGAGEGLFRPGTGYDDHKLGFDADVLRRLIEEAGFVDVRETTYGESRHAGLASCDQSSWNSGLRVEEGPFEGQYYSVFMEGVKPPHGRAGDRLSTSRAAPDIRSEHICPLIDENGGGGHARWEYVLRVMTSRPEEGLHVGGWRALAVMWPPHSVTSNALESLYLRCVLCPDTHLLSFLQAPLLDVHQDTSGTLSSLPIVGASDIPRIRRFLSLLVPFALRGVRAVTELAASWRLLSLPTQWRGVLPNTTLSREAATKLSDLAEATTTTSFSERMKEAPHWELHAGEGAHADGLRVCTTHHRWLVDLEVPPDVGSPSASDPSSAADGSRRRKRLLLVHPHQMQRLHPTRERVGSAGGASFVTCSTDLDAADVATRFPAATTAHALQHQMQSGDLLFVPAAWSHYEDLRDPLPFVTLNYYHAEKATDGTWVHICPEAT